jgi:hypothetical protein
MQATGRSGILDRPRSGQRVASRCLAAGTARMLSTSLFTSHGLPILFAAVAIESFGVPIPGETALIAFGVLAAQGDYSIVSVIAIAGAGADRGRQPRVHITDKVGTATTGDRVARAPRC